MAIQYHFSSEGDLLVVTASGFDESLGEVEQYSMAVVEKAVQVNCTAILCDEIRLEYRLGTLDTFKAAEFIAGRAPKLGKAAIVCNIQGASDGKFWETVAVNRGLSVRVFTDLSEARRWLLEG
jgi:hypothetical protein